jgi:hypothetical protein
MEQHSKLKSDKPGVNSDAPEGLAVPVTHMAPVL